MIIGLVLMQSIQPTTNVPDEQRRIEVHRYVTKEMELKEFDTVSISEESRQLYVAKQHLEDRDYERQKKIEQLKHEIALQRYDISEKKMDIIVENILMNWPI
jgi:anti-sigma28 factor (negative regulator of flagellin synthesis)